MSSTVNLWIQRAEDDPFSDEAWDHPRLEEPIDSGLSNLDYNLDSPLNPDFINGLIELFRASKTPDHHRIRIEKEFVKIAGNLGIVKNELRTSDYFHHDLGQLLSNVSIPTGNPPEGIRELLTIAREDKILSNKFLVEFQRRVSGESTSDMSDFSHVRAANANRSVGYLIMYIQLHIVILIMNGCSDR